MLMKEYPDNFGFSVSHTTRNPREGEQDGREYHFVTKEVIEKEIAQGLFAEHANVHGNYYGTSKAALRYVNLQNRTPILDIDVQGAQQVKNTDLDARFVFISPPSFDELEKRLRGRGTEKEEAVVKRLAGAKKEIAFQQENGDFFDLVIVNDDLPVAYDRLKSFINSQ